MSLDSSAPKFLWKNLRSWICLVPQCLITDKSAKASISGSQTFPSNYRSIYLLSDLSYTWENLWVIYIVSFVPVPQKYGGPFFHPLLPDSCKQKISMIICRMSCPEIQSYHHPLIKFLRVTLSNQSFPSMYASFHHFIAFLLNIHRWWTQNSVQQSSCFQK